MIYRRKCDLEKTPIEGCMGGKGTVWMEKLLLGPEEMRGKGRAYVRHTLNRGVSIGTHTHEISQAGEEPLVLNAQVLFA